jgi:TolA-binding protein
VEDSAARRFAAANEARRAGDSNRAATLYREVVRDFSGSPEAAMSELRLGHLLLEKGKAGAALEQFQRHLKRPGALVPEALYGRGRALAALDEQTAERQTWQRLLREFPGSPYAAHARRRLDTLNGSVDSRTLGR